MLKEVQKKSIDFKGQNIYIGIDVHLKSWTVSILTEHLFHKTFSQPAEAEVLIKYLHTHFPGASYHTAYEAVFCGFWIHYKFLSMGINSMVIKAADIPTGQKEKVRKTDAVDSRKIADSLRDGDLEAIHVLSRETLGDRSLLRVCHALVRDMLRTKQGIKSYLYFNGISYPQEFTSSNTHWSKRFITWLRKIELPVHTSRQGLDILVSHLEEQRSGLLDATRKIRALSRTDRYAENVRLLDTIPGVGLISSMTLLTELGPISRFKNTDHLAGYVGLVPDCSDSGDRKNDGEMTFRTKNILLSTLVVCSWTAACKDSALSLKFNQCAQRMEPNKAIIRVARKLLNRIYFVLKNQKEYVYSVVK